MNDPYFVRFQKIQKMWFQISEIYEQNCEKFPETFFFKTFLLWLYELSLMTRPNFDQFFC